MYAHSAECNITNYCISRILNNCRESKYLPEILLREVNNQQYQTILKGLENTRDLIPEDRSAADMKALIFVARKLKEKLTSTLNQVRGILKQAKEAVSKKSKTMMQQQDDPLYKVLPDSASTIIAASLRPSEVITADFATTNPCSNDVRSNNKKDRDEEDYWAQMQNGGFLKRRKVL